MLTYDGKRVVVVGLYSGAVAGLVGSLLLGLYLTAALIIIDWDLAMAYFLLPALAIGLPIGLLVGALGGLLIGILVSRLQLVNQAPGIGMIVGVLIGVAYPLVLLVAGDDPLAEVVAALVGGLIIGCFGGRLGGHVFRQRLGN